MITLHSGCETGVFYGPPSDFAHGLVVKLVSADAKDFSNAMVLLEAALSEGFA